VAWRGVQEDEHFESIEFISHQREQLSVKCSVRPVLLSCMPCVRSVSGSPAVRRFPRCVERSICSDHVIERPRFMMQYGLVPIKTGISREALAGTVSMQLSCNFSVPGSLTL